MSGMEEIGCYGAYCGTCREYLKTCKGCEEYDRCESIQSFLNHPGYKYGKYKQALEYIRAHGHAAFLNAAEHWTSAYGKYPKQDS